MLVDDELTRRAKTRVGQVLRGKWRLDELLGVGGMAAVYAATHRNTSRGAVKMLHVELSLQADLQARFLREGRVANEVGHPGVVRVLDDDVADDGSVFLVMELLEGETLEGRWARMGRALPVGEVLAITDRLLDVLSAAHQRCIIHRDIKPANIFLTDDGGVKVLDFGIARVQDALGASSRTRTGSMLGTPAFMPPEQARGRVSEVDARSDLWAVGATMFTLLSGRMVRWEGTANEQLIQAGTTPVDPLATVLPTVSPLVAELVDRAMRFPKEERWQTAAAMRQAIADIVHRATPPAARAAPLTPRDGHGAAAEVSATGTLLAPAAPARTPPASLAVRVRRALPRPHGA